MNSLVNAQMKIRLLKWKTMGKEGATELGNNSVSGAVTMEETKKSLRNIHKIVSMEVSYADTLTLVGPHAEPADGSRLSDGDLLHTALNLDSTDYGVAIAPEFRIDNTRLEPTGYTYGGVVDYMIIYTDRYVWYERFALSLSKHFPDVIAQSPKFAFLSDAVRKLLSCSIYEAKAKSDAVMSALPQAAMAAAVKAKNLGYVRFVLSNMVIYPHHRVDTF
jgi:hypothetical protein